MVLNMLDIILFKISLDVVHNNLRKNTLQYYADNLCWLLSK